MPVCPPMVPEQTGPGAATNAVAGPRTGRRRRRYVFAGIMHLADPEKYVSPVLQLLSGGLMLGAVFMATDYVTSPMSKKGMLIYGVCIGLLTFVIRLFGAYPEGMSFAILIMNAFTPLINTYCKPKRFGEVAKKK